jgi:hypothetical protein
MYGVSHHNEHLASRYIGDDTKVSRYTHDRSQSAQRSTDGQTTETAFRDRCVNDSLVTKSIQQTLGHLVGTVVLGDLLSQNEDLLILL